MNEGHFKDLLFELIPPPAQKGLTRAAGAGTSVTNPSADLMMMGFPTRLPDTSPPTLCVCHSELKSQGFLCPRCLAKVCDVPTDCDICGLMIVSSPHLARSYHHLFPVKPYDAVYVNYRPSCCFTYKISRVDSIGLILRIYRTLRTPAMAVQNLSQRLFLRLPVKA
jgi:hypothetical protein